MKNKPKLHLFRYLKPYRKDFIIAVMLIIFECALEISIPFLMKLMLDKGLTPTETGYDLHLDQALLYGGIMLVFAVVAFFLGLYTAKFTAKAGRGLGYEMRKEEYRKIQQASFRELDEFRLNSLITRTTNDIQNISDAFCQTLRPILRSPVQLCFAFTFAILISKELSVVFAVVVPVLALSLFLIVSLTRPLFYKLQSTLDRINRTTQESLVAMKLVRANSKMDYEEEKFLAVNDDLRHVSNQSLGLLAGNMAIMETMTYITIISVLYIGSQTAIMNYRDATKVTDITTFLSYTAQTLASLRMLSDVFMTFTRSQASARRIAEVFASSSELKENSDSTLKVTHGSITFDHVSFKYKASAKEDVIKDISFTIKDGQFVGILGQTGSGKSTLANLIERFYDVSSGRILIDDNDIRDYRFEELRDSIAICFQNPTLFTGTIRDNILWGRKDAAQEEIDEACRIACCYDFITTKLSQGFDTPIGESGTNVSGGQRQRIAIARALIRKPKILILDDSFSALDRITEGQLKENLTHCLPDMTKIVISQKVSTIKEADQILVLSDGVLDGVGTSDTLLATNDIYRSIYEIQKEAH